MIFVMSEVKRLPPPPVEQDEPGGQDPDELALSSEMAEANAGDAEINPEGAETNVEGAEPTSSSEDFQEGSEASQESDSTNSSQDESGINPDDNPANADESRIDPVNDSGSDTNREPNHEEVENAKKGEVEKHKARIEDLLSTIKQESDLGREVDIDRIIGAALDVVSELSEFAEVAPENLALEGYVRIYAVLERAELNLTDMDQLRVRLQRVYLKRKYPQFHEVMKQALEGQGIWPADAAQESESSPQPEAAGDQAEVGQKVENWVESLEQECQKLNQLIEQGESKLPKESAESFASVAEFQKFYRDLANQETRVLKFTEQVVQDINAADLEPVQKIDLKERVKAASEQALKEAGKFRHEKLIPEYFGLKAIDGLSHFIETRDDLASGRKNPEDLQFGADSLDAIDFANRLIEALNWALNFELNSEDKNLIEEKLADMQRKLQILEKAKQYHQEFKDFKNKQDNQDAEAIAKAAADSQIDIATKQTERRAAEALNVFKNRETLLADHRERLQSELEGLDEGSAAREEANSLLNQVSQALEKNKQAREMVAQAQLEVYLDKDEIKKIISIMEEIGDIDIASVRSDPALAAEFRQKQNDFNAIVKEVKDADLLSTSSAAGYPENEKVDNQIKQLKEQIEKTGEHIETADRERFIERKMEEIWKEIRESDAPTMGPSATPANTELRKNLLQFAEELSQFENRGHEINKWKLKLQAWNAFLKLPGHDDVLREFASSNAKEMRPRIAGVISIGEMRELMEMEGLRELVDAAESIFYAGTIKYVDFSGNPIEHPITGNPMTDADGNPYTHNYARSGDPGDSEINRGEKMKLADYLKALFPNNLDSDVFATQLIAVLGELRPKVEVPYYALYAETPTTFDLKPIEEAATAAYILYKIMSGGVVRQPGQRFFASSRLPSIPGEPGEVDSVVVDAETGERMAKHAEQLSRAIHPPREEFAEILAKPDKQPKEYDNIEAALRGRKIYDGLITSAELPRVELRADFQHMPMIWDILRADSTSPFLDLTFAKYEDIANSWISFLDKIEDKPKVAGTAKLSAKLREAVTKFSANKGMWTAIKGSAYQDFYEGVLEQMYLRYIKDLFDQFDVLARRQIANEDKRREEFAKIARREIKSLGTLPGFLENYMVDLLDLSIMNNKEFKRLHRDNREMALRSRFAREVLSSSRPVNINYRMNAADTLEGDGYRQFWHLAEEKQEADEPDSSAGGGPSL